MQQKMAYWFYFQISKMQIYKTEIIVITSPKKWRIDLTLPLYGCFLMFSLSV